MYQRPTSDSSSRRPKPVPPANEESLPRNQCEQIGAAGDLKSPTPMILIEANRLLCLARGDGEGAQWGVGARVAEAVWEGFAGGEQAGVLGGDGVQLGDELFDELLLGQ